MRIIHCILICLCLVSGSSAAGAGTGAPPPDFKADYALYIKGMKVAKMERRRLKML